MADTDARTLAASAQSAGAGRGVRTAGYYVAFVALGLAGASLGPTLPALAAQVHTPLSGISFLFTAGSLGYLLGSYQGGRAYDRLPGHPVMAVVLVTLAVVLALLPIVPALSLLIVVRLVMGLAMGTMDVGGNVLLVWVHGHRVGPFMNGLHFFWGLGAFLSPVIIARVLLASGGIRWAYWVLALLMLPPAVWLLRLRSPAPPAAQDGEGSEQGNDLLVALLALLLFLYVAAEAGFGEWIYTYAVAMGLNDRVTAAYLASAFWGALTLGRLLAIPIAARFTPRAILLADVLGSLASVGIVLVFPGSRVATWAGTLGAGLSIASVFPTTVSLAERYMRVTGRVAGWLGMGASAGGMSVPWLIGQFFESSGPHVTMVAIMGDLLVSVGVYAALVACTRRASPVVAKE